MDISTGQGAEEGGERRGAKAAVEVRNEAGLKKTVEGEECSMRVRGMRMGGTEKSHKSFRRGKLGAGEERESGGERVEHGKRRQTNKRMRESKIRQ